MQHNYSKTQKMANVTLWVVFLHLYKKFIDK